jgi:hypothetical protein
MKAPCIDLQKCSAFTYAHRLFPNCPQPLAPEVSPVPPPTPDSKAREHLKCGHCSRGDPIF